MQCDMAFSGAGYDRAAHVRTDQEALAELKANPNTRAIVLWRGKPLLEIRENEQSGCLLRLPLDHPILTEAKSPPVFLGFGKDAIFAYDISTWQPPQLDEALLRSFADPTRQSHPALATDQYFCELRMQMCLLDALDAELAATAKAILHWHQSHKFCAACGGLSVIGAAGWQRDCPACNTPHFPRTDPVVIMLITDGARVLLGRSHGWPEGMYSLPAGFVEPGETIEAAVRREVNEETNIKVGNVRYLISQPWPFPASLMLGCAGAALSDEITVDPHELDDALWLSKDDLMLAFAGEHPKIKPARRGSIAHHILYGWLAGRY